MVIDTFEQLHEEVKAALATKPELSQQAFDDLAKSITFDAMRSLDNDDSLYAPHWAREVLRLWGEAL